MSNVRIRCLCGNSLSGRELRKLLKNGKCACNCGRTVQRRNGIILFFEPSRFLQLRRYLQTSWFTPRFNKSSAALCILVHCAPRHFFYSSTATGNRPEV